ncbi:MAG: hypothetical protein NVSMB64_33040 [Candidatus Velthaea sp.]
MASRRVAPRLTVPIHCNDYDRFKRSSPISTRSVARGNCRGLVGKEYPLFNVVSGGDEAKSARTIEATVDA